MSQNRNHHHQVLTAEPIYQIRNAVDEFNTCVKPYREELEKKIQKNGESTLSQFHFIRRAWEPPGSDQDKNGHYNYTYYEVETFDGKFQNIIKSLKNSNGQIARADTWSEFFGHFKQIDIPAIRSALEFLNSLANGSGDDDSAKLHHYLLQLYCRVKVDGHLPCALDKLSSVKKPCFYRVELLSEKNGNLPQFKVCWLDGKEETSENSRVQEDITMEKNGGARIWSDYIVRLYTERDFLNGNDGDDGRAGMRFLFIPVYDYYMPNADNPFCGLFLGWLFQILPKDNKFDVNTLKDYVNNCLPFTRALAKDLHSAAMREILNQELKEESCIDFLKRRLHHLGDWKMTDIDGDIEDDDLFKYENPKLTIGLDSTRFDPDPPEFRNLDKDPVLHLVFGKDFTLPKDDADQDTYLTVMCNRIRTLYRQLKYRKLEAEHRTKASDALARAHLFDSIRSSVDDLVDLLREVQSPVQDLVHALTPAGGLIFGGQLTEKFFPREDVKKVALNERRAEFRVTHDWNYSRDAGGNLAAGSLELHEHLEQIAAVLLTVLGEAPHARKPFWDYLRLFLATPPEPISKLCNVLVAHLDGLKDLSEHSYKAVVDNPDRHEENVLQLFRATKAWFHYTDRPATSHTGLPVKMLQACVELWGGNLNIENNSGAEATEFWVPSAKIIDTLAGLDSLQALVGGFTASRLELSVGTKESTRLTLGLAKPCPIDNPPALAKSCLMFQSELAHIHRLRRGNTTHALLQLLGKLPIVRIEKWKNGENKESWEVKDGEVEFANGTTEEQPIITEAGGTFVRMLARQGGEKMDLQFYSDRPEAIFAWNKE